MSRLFYPEMGYSRLRFMGSVMTTRTPTPANNVMPQVLRAARLATELSQADLARRLRKPQSFVSKIETGERSLNVVEFAIIARAIGVDPLALFAEVIEALPQGAAL